MGGVANMRVIREYASVRDMVVFFGSQFARDGGGKRGGFLEAMKVDQLKVELAERGSTRSGRKAILAAAPSAHIACAGGNRAT